MSAFLDNISRIIARPVSRRQAMKLVGEAVGGAILTSLGWSQTVPSGVVCGKGHCKSNQICCGGTSANAICCSGTSTCCNSTGKLFCCNSGCTCCPMGGRGNAQCCSGTVSSTTCNTCSGSSGCTSNGTSP